MDQRLGGPGDPVDLFHDHIEQFGSAEASQRSPCLGSSWDSFTAKVGLNSIVQ